MLPLVGLIGCIEIGLDPIDDTDPPVDLVAVTESFVQEPLPGVDVLFVVDDTASMAQEQAALAAEFGALAAMLDGLEVSWHAGVVTTDMSGADAGWLVGSPYVLTSATEEVTARFAEIVQVGTRGAAPEAGLAAALRALSLSGVNGPNAAFRRPDAALHVVFVSDADDGSDVWLGEDPVGTFLTALDDEAARTGLPAVASAIVGDVPLGCVSGRAVATAAYRYHAAVERSGGAAVSICDTSFEPILSAIGDVTVVWRTRFPLARAPLDGTVRVNVNDAPAEDWSLDLEPPAVVFATPPPASSWITVRYVVESP